MRRRFAPVVVALLFAACTRPPVTDEVTVTIEKNDRVLVTAETTFNDADIKSETRLQMLEAARFAAMHNNDAWAARFGRVSAEDEEITVRKHNGQLDRVTRTVRIPSNQLQQVFSDTNITVNLLNGEGWRELALIPGGSMRATREQQRHFEDALQSWSGSVARYLMAIDHLYTYLELNRDRGSVVFSALLRPDWDATVGEGEKPLVDSVTAAMEEIAAQMDRESESGAGTFAEEADLIYNAFPARMTVRVPGDVISKEGFEKELVIEQVALFDILTSLEGKWISPDPLAQLLREETKSDSLTIRWPLRSTKNVTAAEVANAIRAQLARPKMYVVRWRE